MSGFDALWPCIVKIAVSVGEAALPAIKAAWESNECSSQDIIPTLIDGLFPGRE